MKRKVNFQFLGIAGLAIITTLILAVFVFYNLFRQQILEELQTYTHVLEKTISTDKLDTIGSEIREDGLRITVIDVDGTVQYDNMVDAASLENHGDRPEVKEAMKHGSGTVIRRSKTLEKNSFYYAQRLDDNRILRASKEAGSIWQVLFGALPQVVLVMLLIFLICIVLAQLLIRSLMRPIEQMAHDIDQIEKVNAYDELIPFVKTIQQQHLDIVNSAKIRQEFTANVSHELKTPLTSISGYAELIETGMASETDINRFAGEIQKSSNRLLHLINDIIELSKLDSMDMSATFQGVDLYHMGELCLETLKESAIKHQVSIRLEGVRAVIMGNPRQIEELIYNLCDNAIRYNDPGGEVLITITEEDKGVSVRVKDNGIGISREHWERVFERFYRVDKSRSKSTGGTGLGLAIVKHIVAQHSAKIQLNSKVGLGTEIIVFFEKEEDL